MKSIYANIAIHLLREYALAVFVLLAVRLPRRPPSVSKITRPSHGAIVPRARLFRAIDRGLKGQVFWVAGPPGSGKTSLVSSYVTVRRRPCLWYHVDAGDADPASFFHYLQMAADAFALKHRKKPVRLTPERLPSPGVFSQKFVENLFGLLAPRGLLVLDNVQGVPAESAFYGVLRDSLARLPQGVNAILIGREDPPAHFARFRVSNPGGYLGWNDLRLTEDEVGEILRMRRGGKVGVETVRQMHARSGGWMAGLVLLLETDRSGLDEPRSLARRAPDEIVEYFGDEVFNRLDEDKRRFLMTTAFLPELTPRSAEFLAENPKAGQILADLYRNGHFTEKHAGAEPVFRYHSLFREFLRHRAERALAPGEISAIRRRAASVLEESGRIEEAAHLLHEVGDWEGLARIVRDHGRSFVREGRERTLEKWALAIPEGMRKNDPWLLYWSGVCNLGVSLGTSRACFETALGLFDARGDTEGTLLAWAGLVGSIVYEWDDFTRLDRWIGWLRRRIARGLAFPSADCEARVATAMLAALIYRRPGSRDKGKWAARALTLSRDSGDGVLKLEVRLYAALDHALAGERVKAAMVAEEGVRLAARLKVPAVLCIGWRCLDAAMKQCGCAEPASAQRSPCEGLKEARQNALRLCGHLLPGLAAMGFLAKGDLGGASRSLREMESALVPPRRHASSLFEFLCAWYQLLRGDVARAAAHAGEALSQAAKSGMVFHEVLCRIAAADIAAEGGKHGEAASGLSAARKLVEGSGSKSLAYLWHLSAARLALDKGRPDAALASLRTGMALGREHGYLNACWWWRRPAMTRLCLAALDAGIEPDYVRRLVVANGLVPDTPPMETSEWPWPLKVFTLGRFALVKEGKAVQFRGRAQQKPLQMLKTLIALGGRGVPEERLVDVLWPDADGDLAHQSFATTLRRLRQLLGNEKAILLRDGRLTLNNRYCWVDAWAFERLLGRAESEWGGRGSGDGPARLVARAIALYQGPFLAGETFCTRLVSVRERLRSKFLRGVEAAGRSCEKAGDPKRAVVFYQKGLEIDELAEEFHRCLIACYRKMGMNAEALRAYRRCEKALSTMLGVKPSRRTEEEAKPLKNL